MVEVAIIRTRECSSEVECLPGFHEAVGQSQHHKTKRKKWQLLQENDYIYRTDHKPNLSSSFFPGGWTSFWYTDQGSVWRVLALFRRLMWVSLSTFLYVPFSPLKRNLLIPLIGSAKHQLTQLLFFSFRYLVLSLLSQQVQQIMLF